MAGVDKFTLGVAQAYADELVKGSSIVNPVSGTYINVDDASHKNLQSLTIYGKSTQEGTPTPDAPIDIVSAGDNGSIEVKVTGKNLCGGALYYGCFSNGIARILNFTEVTLPYLPEKENFGIAKIIPCKKGIMYTYSGANLNENATISISEYGSLEDASDISNVVGYIKSTSVTSSTYTTQTDGILVILLAGKWTDGITTIHECTESELLQIEIGDTATEYEPYQEQTVVIDMPLRGIPVSSGGNYTDANGQQWICDIVDLKNGKYIQNIRKGNPTKTIVFTALDSSGRAYVYTNYFTTYHPKNGASRSYSNIAQWSSWGLSDNSFALTLGAVYYKDSSKTLEEINAMFAELGTSIEFVYALAEPIVKDLTAEQIAAFKELVSYKPNNVIQTNSIAEVGVEYIADTKLYIDKKIAELASAIVATAE